MKNLFKNFAVVILFFFAVSAVFSFISQDKASAPEQLSLSQLVEQINQEKVKQIIIEGNNLKITFSDDKKALAQKETEASLSQTLANYGIDKGKLEKVEIQVKSESNTVLVIGQILSIAVPVLMLVFFFWILEDMVPPFSLPLFFCYWVRIVPLPRCLFPKYLYDFLKIEHTHK